jgi:hypothetical protein
MPIRAEFRRLYPPHWRALSQRVRFERAGGRCQGCGRPHLARVRCLPDGRWFDEAAGTWRNRRGRPDRWPDLLEAGQVRLTRVVLAAAHLDNDPANNRLANLRGLCQRCHMLHDRPHPPGAALADLPSALGAGGPVPGGLRSPPAPGRSGARERVRAARPWGVLPRA